MEDDTAETTETQFNNFLKLVSYTITSTAQCDIMINSDYSSNN